MLTSEDYEISSMWDMLTSEDYEISSMWDYEKQPILTDG